MKIHFALTGFMGSGKTTIGKIIAQKSNVPFIDLDEYIEQRENKTINEIFLNGENYFRALETRYLKEILETPQSTVIALGGGTVCFNNNLQLIRQHAWLIALLPEITILTERLWKEKDKRPLLKNITSKDELAAFIEKKLKERMPFYMQADWIVS
ncbi:MAG: shikimate kinase [Bacteroidetes bacterium]|jgi:shikimate kinase|nr:MAG: shikimate kinase [Bacteroidota bacterium]